MLAARRASNSADAHAVEAWCVARGDWEEGGSVLAARRASNSADAHAGEAGWVGRGGSKAASRAAQRRPPAQTSRGRGDSSRPGARDARICGASAPGRCQTGAKCAPSEQVLSLSRLRAAECSRMRANPAHQHPPRGWEAVTPTRKACQAPYRGGGTGWLALAQPHAPDTQCTLGIWHSMPSADAMNLGAPGTICPSLQ